MPSIASVRSSNKIPSARTRAVVRLLWRVDRPRCIQLLVVIALSAGVSLIRVVALGALVRYLPRALGVSDHLGTADRELWIWFGVLALATFSSHTCSAVLFHVQARLQLRVRADTECRLLQVCSTPEGVAHLESPAFLDELAVAKSTLTGADPGHLVEALVGTLGRRAEAVPMLLILGWFRWWIPLLLLIAAAAQYQYIRDLVANVSQGWSREAMHLRRAEYRRELTLTATGAKEVRVFGWANWLVESFDSAWQSVTAPVWRERQRLIILGVASHLPYLLVMAVVAVSVGRAGLNREIDAGTVIVLLQAAVIVLGIGVYADAQMRAADAAGRLDALATLEARPESHPAPRCSRRQMRGAPIRSIVFDGVSFRYPGADVPVLDNCNLTVIAGSSVAVVGVNGAGKTTLVKLLAGLYQPDSGSILVDGVPLSDIDLRAWRARLGAVFQDFTRWELPARDNVGFGDLSAFSDEAGIRTALARSRALDLVEALPAGLDTVLSPSFEDGIDLSGGQWQRIALARALFGVRHGGLLILDEPTAHLDVRTEAQLFNRTLDLAVGTTTMLISHRFTTVRKASRIVVLDGGRVVEDGTHDELLTAAGRYAGMYRRQAARFTGGTDV